MVEFLEDLIEVDPLAQFPREVAKAGNFVMPTGDAVTDQWSKDIADGKMPDFMAAFTEQESGKIAALLKQAGQRSNAPAVAPSTEATASVQEDDEFEDDYTKDDNNG